MAREIASPATSALSLALRALLVGLLCTLSTEIGFATKIPPHYISPLWPTGAILLSVLVVTPGRHWWVYILAAYFTSVIRDARTGFPPSAVLFVIAGIAEYMIAAVGIRRFANGTKAFEKLRDLVAYFLVAVVLAPLLSSFVAALAAPAGSFWFHWRVWFLSEGLGVLTLAPAILTSVDAARRARWNVSLSSALEASLVVCSLGIICVRVFDWPVAGEGSIPALVYLPLPLLLWAAVRFGPLGANVSLLIVAGLSIAGAVRGHGPFVGTSAWENVLSLQLFLATISVPVMLLAALTHEGREKARILAESEARFRSLADSAPVLIWMSGPDKLCNYLSKGWLDFTGRSLEQELGNGWVEGVHPDDVAECLKVYTTAFHARQDFSMEYRLRRHDGYYRWVWDRGIPRFGVDGIFFGYIGCADDVTERRSMEQSLQAKQHELQLLSGQLLHAQEVERRRIARELHDDLNQQLSLLSVELDLLGKRPPHSTDLLRTKTGELSSQVKQLSSIVQNLSRQLHPAKLEQLGLGPSIRGLCTEVSENYGLTIDFSQDAVPEPMPIELAVCLYRIAQEALRNVVKHSGARHVTLRLSGDEGTISLHVADDGSGFDAVGRTDGLGLISMRERLRLLSGELAITSQPACGTHLDVRVPFPAAVTPAASS